MCITIEPIDASEMQTHTAVYSSEKPPHLLTQLFLCPRDALLQLQNSIWSL